jgi:predicted acylesterase/phospholipase RssA
MRKKCILVGSVGSARAMCSTIGLFYALKYYDFDIIGMTGVSGGSIALPLLAQDISINELVQTISTVDGSKIQDQDITQQAIDWVRNKLGMKRKGDVPFTGVFRGNGLKGELKKVYAKYNALTFENAKIPFSVIATKIAIPEQYVAITEQNPHITFLNAITRNFKEVFKHGDVLCPVRASTAIPLIFRPEKINRCLYVDGGAVESIPVWSAIQEYGKYDVFVADATGDILTEPMFADDVDSLIEIGVATIHSIIRESSLQKLNQSMTLLNSISKQIVLVKPKIKVGMTEVKQYEPAIMQAYDYALKYIPEVYSV